MIAGRFFVTPHAVRRYIARIAPGLTYEQALAEVIALSERAHIVRAEADGSEYWRVGRPERIRLKVARGSGALPAIVTVLREHG